MNSMGICFGDCYRAKPGGAEEIRIDVTGERGILLARALRARVVGTTLYMTPARAEKWRLLFRTGYTAHRKVVHGQPIWVYSLRFGDKERMVLAEAIKRAREAVDQ